MAMKLNGDSVRAIEWALGRAHAPVCREIKRTNDPNAHRHKRSQLQAATRYLAHKASQQPGAIAIRVAAYAN